MKLVRSFFFRGLILQMNLTCLALSLSEGSDDVHSLKGGPEHATRIPIRQEEITGL